MYFSRGEGVKKKVSIFCSSHVSTAPYLTGESLPGVVVAMVVAGGGDGAGCSQQPCALF